MNKEPKYLYKLVPGSHPDLLPSPMPDELPLSELDRKDGFVHLSTAAQVPGTIQRFFGNENQVHVLKLEYSILKEKIKWEDPHGQLGEIGAEYVFPHLYREVALGKDDILEVFEVKKQRDETWDTDILKKNSKLVY